MTGNRVIIITGGTGGLGQALAAQHLRDGDEVVITGRSRERLEAVKAVMNHPCLHLYLVDVTRNEEVKAFAAWVQVRFGRCDMLYNNAGSAVFKPFLEMRPEEITGVLRTNLDGVLFVTRAFLPMMLTRRHGRIVQIASLAGQTATAKAAVYAASKAAIIRFSEGLRQELAGSGVTITCAMPGPIDTPFLQTADPSGQYREKVRAHLLAPEQAARLIRGAAENGVAEIGLPVHLHLLAKAYQLLPARIQSWFAPLLNRK